MSVLNGKKIVLGVTGGIAAYKSVYLLRLLKKAGAEVTVVTTEASLNFVGEATWNALSGKKVVKAFFDNDNDSFIPHIDFAQKSDLIIIAPATSNILAKAANGIADDILSSVLCARSIPVLFAPGMNQFMYENKATERNIKTLSEDTSVYFVEPGEGELACMTTGKGRMAEPDEIFAYAESILSPKPYQNTKWLVTAGATREFLDPIRYLTNGSTGKMGLMIAEDIAEKGGAVTLISGNPSLVSLSKNINIIYTISADDMYNAVYANIKDNDVFIMSAAVADYTPEKCSDSKIKKNNDNVFLFKRTKDILKETSKCLNEKQVRIGFAAETDNLIANAKQKLKDKALDMIIANSVSDTMNPFGNNNNKVDLISSEGIESFPEMSKKKLAEIINSKAFQALRKRLDKKD